MVVTEINKLIYIYIVYKLLINNLMHYDKNNLKGYF